MAGRGINVGAVALAGAGAVVVYAATKGIGLAGGFRALLGGQPLPEGEDLTVTGTGSVLTGDTTLLGGTILGSIAGGNSPIAQAGLAYEGKGTYRWGGGQPSGWDCSGFVNWVLCHDLGLAIPGYAGGTFTGKAHGPVTASWALWSGATTIQRDQVAAGDLVIWPAFHMGIAISNSQMIAAGGPNGRPDPRVSRIDGSSRGPLVCKRLQGRR